MVPYIQYHEDVSNTNQGGLKGQKIIPTHHANTENPSRCLVHLFHKYNELCPHDHPDSSLCLTPTKNPVEQCWYSKVLIRHNKLAETIPRQMKKVGIPGYFTNHPL